MKRLLLLLLIVTLTPLLIFAKGVMNEYRGVKLGLTQEEVRQKLGKPNNSSETDEDYDLGNGNSMQVHYGADKKVDTIVLYFYSNDEKVPKFAEVIGDGKIEKLNDTIEKGKLVDNNGKLSITMVHTGGASPMTVITIKRL